MEEELIESLARNLITSQDQTMETMALAKALQDQNERLLTALEQSQKVNIELMKAFGKEFGMDPKVFEEGRLEKIDQQISALIRRALREASP